MRARAPVCLCARACTYGQKRSRTNSPHSHMRLLADRRARAHTFSYAHMQRCTFVKAHAHNNHAGSKGFGLMLLRKPSSCWIQIFPRAHFPDAYLRAHTNMREAKYARVCALPCMDACTRAHGCARKCARARVHAHCTCRHASTRTPAAAAGPARAQRRKRTKFRS